MTGPLLLLAIPAAIAGFGFFATRFLKVPHADEAAGVVPLLAIIAMVAGVVVGVAYYRNREDEPMSLGLFRERFYFDELYAWLISATQGVLSAIAAFFDRWIIDAGAVRGISSTTWGIGSLLRLFQAGNLQAYVFLFGLGIVGLLYLTLFR
jgi:NADH-quinone oxidoreductase subunit L